MEQAEAYLNQIPMWTREKHSLEEVREYLDALGSPDRGLPAVHIAGTNGKGSVCAFLTSVLAEAGYRVGTFTSPHLVDIRERFQINGAMISREAFSQGFNEVLRMVREMEEKGHAHPSFFEFLFYMAMVIFREARVDVMVIETGLGGRLDATNVLEHPAAVVITSISLDHTEYLGDTIEKIAGEKAGIIKAGVPVIFDDSIPSVRTVIEGTAFRRGAARYPVRAADCQVEGIQAGHLEMTARLLRGGSLHLSIPFEAVYQAQNAMLAVRDAGGASRPRHAGGHKLQKRILQGCGLRSLRGRRKPCRAGGGGSLEYFQPPDRGGNPKNLLARENGADSSGILPGWRTQSRRDRGLSADRR